MKKMSKWAALALALALLTTAALAVNGRVQKTLDYSGIKISVNGTQIKPTDVNGKSTEPFAMDGTVYLPIRAISEALGCDVEWDAATNTVRVSTQTQSGLLYTFHNDGVAKITDADQDKYFAQGSAKAGIEALLNAGKVYVNNVAVPATANETDSYVINGFSSLWKTGESTWAYSVHKLYSGTDLTFEEARMGFIEGISQMRGLTVELYSEDGSGHATRMETLIKESTLVNSMTTKGSNTYIGRYDFALATDELRPDVNNVTFPSKNVDPELKVGDIALYWFDGSEWHIQRAVAETGTLVKGSGEEKFVLNGTAHSDALITRYNLQAANRTSQFLTAHDNLGLTGIPVTMWSTETGYPIGFTRGDNARTALQYAVINARSIAGNYEISKDGSDVLTSQSWVTQDVMDAYIAAIEDAEAVLADAKATNIDLDMAIYNVSSALGSATGRNPSGLLGNAKQGSKAVLASVQENGSTPITDASFDQYFKGTAAAGVEEILNAGKFYVNGFALPAKEGEFNINLGFITLAKNADGSWSSSVHKGNTSDPTFEAARLKLAEGLTKFAGLYVDLFDDNGDGYADRIETTVKQSVRVDEIIAVSGGYRIDRTNFKVAEKAGAKEVNDVIFPADHVDPALKAGDIGLYWETPDGFYIDRCASKIGRLTEGTDHGYYVFDGVRYEDIGGVTKFHLAKANRPGQFLEAMRSLGLLGKVDIIAWTVGDYQIAAYSNLDSTEILSKGIEAARSVLNGAGAGAALNDQIAAASAVLANSASTSADLDRAFYDLALAVDAVK